MIPETHLPYANSVLHNLARSTVGIVVPFLGHSLWMWVRGHEPPPKGISEEQQFTYGSLYFYVGVLKCKQN